MRWERSLAAELTVELVDTDDRAVAARPVVDLLAAYIPTDWPMVEPTVERLLGSEHEAARRAGAVLACLAALQEPGAAGLLERCLTDDDEVLREATAGVLSANLSGARYAVICADGLKRLFEDESSKVREAATRSFWHMRHGELGEFEELARALLGSRALAEGRSQLIHALAVSTAEVASLVVELAEKVLENTEGLADIRTAAAGDAKDLSELIVRALGDTRDDPALRARALDALDRLVAAGAWGVVEAMESIER